MIALLNDTEALVRAGVAGGIAVVVGLVLHGIVFALAGRLTRLSSGTADEVVVDHLRAPLRWAIVAVALSVGAEASPLLARIWGELARFVTPALLGWTAYALVRAFADVLEHRTGRIEDEIAVRSRRTRIAILSRTAAFIIVFVTIALMLFNVPGVRNIGATLMASAGLATLAVGAAAQPALKSLIAGMQIALTEPIRIGDYVVVEGEQGTVEDIRMSYVVIRTGDERRLIVPTAKFLDASFQNWTRVGGGIAGAVVVPVKPGTPIAPVREAYLTWLKQAPDWDGRSAALHVDNVLVDQLSLKLVMSARDPAALNRLRLSAREALVEWLRETQPDGICQGGEA